MKYIFSLILFLFIVGNVSAQCQAEAGDTLYICAADSAATFSIGGAPSASGGAAPYKYTWWIKPIQWFPGSSLIFHASDILDDTTKANPTITSPEVSDSIVFFLEVEDSLGCKSRDSSLMVYSSYVQNLGYVSYSIDKGDSVYLNLGSNVSGGIGTLSYKWQPTHGLSDSTKLNGFWTKPDSSIKYRVTVTDEIGCQETGAPYYHISVNQIGIDEQNLLNSLAIYPNPVNDLVQIETTDGSKIRSLEFRDLSGRVVLRFKEPDTPIDVSSLTRGIYLIKIRDENGSAYRRVIKD